MNGGICGPNGSGTCTFSVPITQDILDQTVSGEVYVNVHLDYGLEGPQMDANLCDDGLLDRYESAGGSSPWNSSDALINDTPVIGIEDCQDLAFGHDAGSGAFSDIVQNLNQYKGLAGGYGRGHTSADGNGVEGATVILTRSSTNEVVMQGTTDADGYYTLPYKHKGKRALYRIGLWGAGEPLEEVIELQGNGWAEVNFDVSTGTIDASWKGEDKGGKGGRGRSKK
jgi:hypothetical protein